MIVILMNFVKIFTLNNKIKKIGHIKSADYEYLIFKHVQLQLNTFLRTLFKFSSCSNFYRYLLRKETLKKYFDCLLIPQI